MTDPYRGAPEAQSTIEKLADLKCEVSRWNEKWLIRSRWTEPGGVYTFSVDDNDADLVALIDRTHAARATFFRAFV